MTIKQTLIMMSASLLISLPALAKKYPDVSEDGLTRVKHKTLDAAYFDTQSDLSVYRQVAIADIEVEFRKNWQRDQNRTRRDVQHQITDEDMDRMRSEVAAELRDVFTQELEEGGYPVVGSAGEDVLLISPKIVDLDIWAPDVYQRSAGRTTAYTENSGYLTLNMDLADSESEAVIGRVIDRRRGRGDMTVRQTNLVTNKQDARRVMRRWAWVVRDALDEARSIN